MSSAPSTPSGGGKGGSGSGGDKKKLPPPRSPGKGKNWRKNNPAGIFVGDRSEKKWPCSKSAFKLKDRIRFTPSEETGMWRKSCNHCLKKSRETSRIIRASKKSLAQTASKNAGEEGEEDEEEDEEDLNDIPSASEAEQDYEDEPLQPKGGSSSSSQAIKA